MSEHVKPVTEIDRSQWQQKAQPGELAFHKKPNFRADDAKFNEANTRFFSGLGFRADQFAGRTVVDVGAGSRLRGKYFADARLVAIEPLAEQFLAEVPWCDLRDAAELHAAPAEQYIPNLVRSADFVFSVNVLDHCFNFKDCIVNIYNYLRDDGIAFLSFDAHNKIDDLHPLILDEAIARQVFDEVGFKVERFRKMGTYHRGLADYALGFWLRV